MLDKIRFIFENKFYYFERIMIYGLYVDTKIDLKDWSFLIHIRYNQAYDFLSINIICVNFTFYTKDSLWFEIHEE